MCLVLPMSESGLTTINIKAKQLGDATDTKNLQGKIIFYYKEPNEAMLVVCDGIVDHPTNNETKILVAHHSNGELESIDWYWAIRYGRLFMCP